MELQDLIGYAAATLGLFAYLPQVIKTCKTKQTKDISLAMYMVLWLGVFLWLTYGILLKKPPLIIVNTAVITFVSIMLVFKIKYK